LRASGIIETAAVSAVDIEALGEATGFTGQVVRLSPRYDSAGAGAPRTMIAKLPPSDPQTQGFGRALNFYAREAAFYRELGNSSGIRTPECYCAAADAQGLAVLLLEDLSPLAPGDQVAGWTRDQVILAVERLAAFHAEWWQRPELDGLGWMPAADDAAAVQMASQAYQYAWGPFLDRFGELLPPDARKIGERLAAGIGGLLAAFAAPPRTIMHGDYRMDNLFFGGNDGEFAVIDWQLACRGRGTFDVAYLMSQSGAPDLRRSIEGDMLRLYCETLAAHGVDGAEFDACFEHYRQGILYGLVYPVIVGGTLPVADRRAEELVRIVTDRVVQAILDLDAGQCLA